MNGSGEPGAPAPALCRLLGDLSWFWFSGSRLLALLRFWRAGSFDHAHGCSKVGQAALTFCGDALSGLAVSALNGEGCSYLGQVLLQGLDMRRVCLSRFIGRGLFGDGPAR